LLHAEECFDRYIVAETLSFDTILLKMREWCNVARLYRLGTMRNDSTQLTPDRKAVMALIMNQHGLTTREVMFHLQRKDGAGRYAFQQAIVRPPHRVVVGRPQVVGGGGEAVAVPAPAPQQTAVVRVERVVACPPPVAPEDELWYIRQHVNISRGPRGYAIRDKRGRMVKEGRTREMLFAHVLANIPNWQEHLSCV